MVSILIPCYNAERWIAAAIESALAQTWPDKEVIVVDDGSTDGSLPVIERYRNAIRYESGPNRGGNRVRNRLLELARGEWVQYLDADDYLLPGKIAGQVACLSDHAAADVIFGPMSVEYIPPRTTDVERLPIPEPHDPWVLLALWYLPQTGSPLWRRRAIEEVGGWTPDQPVCQEHELYLRLLMAGKHFVYCESGGAVWRVWGTASVSTSRPRLVRRHRMAITLRAESFLRERGELTSIRQGAINRARFEMARVAWREGDREGAREAIAAVTSADPDFEPKGEPWLYQLLWRQFGFDATEKIVGWRRSIRSRARV